ADSCLPHQLLGGRFLKGRHQPVACPQPVGQAWRQNPRQASSTRRGRGPAGGAGDDRVHALLTPPAPPADQDAVPAGTFSGSLVSLATSPCPGHQAAWPISAVSDGTSSSDITNADSRMPTATEKPICCRKETGARASTPNVPARMSPAAPTVGPAC